MDHISMDDNKTVNNNDKNNLLDLYYLKYEIINSMRLSISSKRN
jgi:hypothetical protein